MPKLTGLPKPGPNRITHWLDSNITSPALFEPVTVFAYSVAGFSSPDSAALGNVRARVLGLYAGEDARVDATVPGAQRAAMNAGARRAARRAPAPPARE